MALLEEMFVAASSVESPLIAWDINTGKILASYKQSSCFRHSLCTVGEDYFAASQANKSGGAIFFWQWKKTTTATKSFPHEVIGPIASTFTGNYIVGGGHSGRCYLWEVSTGNLLRTWPAHLSAVECLAFSEDDSLLFSGGQDGVVNVWPLVRVAEVPHRDLHPLYTLQAHTQKVNWLCSGSGGGAALLVSSSEDRTCKFFSVGLGHLLRSIIFPVAVRCAMIAPQEDRLFAGGADGRIFITPLVGEGRGEIQGRLGGEEEGGNGEDELLEGHQRAITGLSFSLDGSVLVSASEDGTAIIWCTTSKKILRRVNHPRGPITSILVVPKPPFLPSQNENSLQKSANQRLPTVPPTQLKRYTLGTELGAETDGNPWEGPPVLISPISDADVALEDTSDWTKWSTSRDFLDSQMDFLADGASLSFVHSSLEQKREELKRALDVAEKWKERYDQSFQIASELYKHVDQLKRPADKEKSASGTTGALGKQKEKGKGKGAKTFSTSTGT